MYECTLLHYIYSNKLNCIDFTPNQILNCIINELNRNTNKYN